MDISNKMARGLRRAGREYIGDRLLWDEKKLNELATAAEKRQFIDLHFGVGDAAYDMGASFAFEYGGYAESYADYIHEGMMEVIKNYLKKNRTPEERKADDKRSLLELLKVPESPKRSINLKGDDIWLVKILKEFKG